jgi:flavin-dependent dehydrogenase
VADESTLTQIATGAAGAVLSGITGAGVTLALGEGFALANRIIGYIDNPAKRAKARREYIDALEAIREKIKTEDGAVNQLLLDLIAAVHNK